DTRVLRDLEVMKADHDLDTTVIEGSLVVIRERYSIPVEYGLYVPQPGQRPYSLDTPGMCISVDALEVGLRFPLHSLIEECLRWWRISPSQVAPNSWRYLVVFLGKCRGVGIILTRDLFHGVFSPLQESGRLLSHRPSRFSSQRGAFQQQRLEVPLPFCERSNLGVQARLVDTPDRQCLLVLIRGGIRPNQMDLDELRGMPKVSSGKAPPTHAATREVGSSPAMEAPNASSKRPVDIPVEQAADVAKRHKKIKVLTRRHKPVSARRGLALDPKARSPQHREMEGAEELDEGLEQLVGSGGVREGTSPSPTGVGALHDPLGGPARPSHQGDGLELDALKSDGGPKAVAKAEGCASELQEELEKTRREKDEALRRHEASEKELHKVRSNLVEAHRLLKEVRVRAWKMDDELLQAVKALDSARAELPKQMVVQYKESLGFKECMKRMGRVTYEYVYRVALTSFHARHLDAEVEEDPFTIHPEDDLVSMERQQAFDDSVPPKP
ncbi:hypothetical protein B296_00046801, partial [Ensete ventricosum]